MSQSAVSRFVLSVGLLAAGACASPTAPITNQGAAFRTTRLNVPRVVNADCGGGGVIVGSDGRCQ
jgi:hypothetical protein